MLTLDDQLSKRRRDFQEGKVILHPTIKIMTEGEEVLINLHRSLPRGIRSSSSSNLINNKIINHSINNTNNSKIINHIINNNNTSSSSNINNNRKMVSVAIKADRPISILTQMTIQL